MTILLDIAALAFLLLVLTFVPVLGLRHEAKITRQLREAAAEPAWEPAGRLAPPTARTAQARQTPAKAGFPGF
jgi:hypothetical protein